MKTKYLIFLTICMIIITTLNLISMIGNSLIVYRPQEVVNLYESIDMKNSSEVIKIADLCKNNSLPIECVYEEIPFKYDFQRAKNNLPDLLTPEMMSLNNYKGVCRDISVFRKSVFEVMGIESYYISEPGHIYVVAFYENRKYILNNELLIY